MLKLRLPLALCIILLLSSCANHVTFRQNPNFDREDLKDGKIIVLPSEAIVHTAGFTGAAKDRMYEYEEHIENIINKKVISVLQKQGYDVRLISPQTIEAQRLSSQVLDIKERFSTEVDKLYARQLMPEAEAMNIQNNIGGGVIKISDGNAHKKTWILICNYSHIAKTNGARVAGVVMDVLLGTRMSDDAEKSTMIIGLIDHKTGDIAWSNLHSTSINAIASAVSGAGKSDEKRDKSEISSMVKTTTAPLFAKNSSKK